MGGKQTNKGIGQKKILKESGTVKKNYYTTRLQVLPNVICLK